MQTLNWLQLFFKWPHFEWSLRSLYSCKTSQQNLNSEPLLETITWSSPAAEAPGVFFLAPPPKWSKPWYAETPPLLLDTHFLQGFQNTPSAAVPASSGISYGCALRLIVKGITLTLHSIFHCQISEFVYLPGSGTSMSGSWKKLRRTSFELTLQLSVHACSINWHNKWVTIQNLTGQKTLYNSSNTTLIILHF